MALIEPKTAEFARNFSIEQFNNVTTVLTPETNNFYVAAEECKRFVIENCYASTKFFMHASIGLLVLCGIAVYLAYQLKKENKELEKHLEEVENGRG